MRSTDVAIDDRPQRKMSEVARDGAVIVVLSYDDIRRVIPAELAQFVENAPQNLVVHPGRVDRVARSGSVSVIGRVRLLRPEDCQVGFLDGKDVIDEHICKVCEAPSGKRATTVERIARLSVPKPLNSGRCRWIAVIGLKRQSTRFVCI